MGYIYEVKNTINGRVYIGKTTTSIRQRWMQHVWHSLQGNYSNDMHTDIELMGKGSFQIRMLYRSENEILLNTDIPLHNQ